MKINTTNFFICYLQEKVWLSVPIKNGQECRNVPADWENSCPEQMSDPAHHLHNDWHGQGSSTKTERHHQTSPGKHYRRWRGGDAHRPRPANTPTHRRYAVLLLSTCSAKNQTECCCHLLGICFSKVSVRIKYVSVQIVRCISLCQSNRTGEVFNCFLSGFEANG